MGVETKQGRAAFKRAEADEKKKRNRDEYEDLIQSVSKSSYLSSHDLLLLK